MYFSIFLKTDKPIIFFPFDLKNYITQDRQLYYNYEDITCGPICYNWEEVLNWIEKFKFNPSLFNEKRLLIKTQFFKYNDAKAMERIIKCMKSL